MRTAYCPKSHVELTNQRVGKPYGHTPGHEYHDVDVVISERNGKYRCHIVESWGSAQGYDEEHGRCETIGRGESIHEACEQAKQRATEADVQSSMLLEALARAEDAAENVIENNAGNTGKP